jgi:ATP phosphoribosyltransferase regulatory subunit
LSRTKCSFSCNKYSIYEWKRSPPRSIAVFSRKLGERAELMDPSRTCLSVKIASLMDRETPRKFATTPGTRDVLPPESTRLLEVQARIRERFRLFGFREVLTPALEYSEVIEEHGLRDASYKLFDQDNQMLLLRPEMTTPIARVVAQRLAGSPGPHKLSYVLPAYRRASVGRGQSAELYQAGVEVVGSASPREDAATIALLLDVLQSLGLNGPSGFAVVLGQSAFYSGYLRHVVPEAATPVTAALAVKDLVAVDALANGLPEGAAAGVRGIPRLVGPATDGSIVEEAERFAVGEEATEALANLREILRHLEAYGALGAVILDLGLTGRHDYYTGAVYEAYASGLGFTIANGGRYDNLLRRFGEEMPATGFAIYLERLLSALPEEGAPPLLVLVGGDVGGVETAAGLREKGVPVLHLPEDLSPEAAAEYARSIDAAWISYPAAGGVKLATVDPPGEFSFMDAWSVAKAVLR